MEDLDPYLNHHHQPYQQHVADLPSQQSPDLGHHSTRPPLVLPEQHGGRGAASAHSVPASSPYSGGSTESSRGGSGGRFSNMAAAAACVEGGVNGLDASPGLFNNSWFAGDRNGTWDEGDSSESAEEGFYRGRDGCYDNSRDEVFYTGDYDCEEREGVASCASISGDAKSSVFFHKEAILLSSHDAKGDLTYDRSSNDNYSAKSTAFYNTNDSFSYDAKYDAFYNRDANTLLSHDANVDMMSSRESESSLEDSRRGNHFGRIDSYTEGEHHFTGHLPQAQMKPGAWVGHFPLGQVTEAGVGRVNWAPVSVSGTYTQKLDSFSEAFSSQRRRAFPGICYGVGKEGNSGFSLDCGQDNPGLVKSEYGGVFESLPDTDLHRPSSNSPHPHLMVLSPPPTPLPPPSLSPPKMDYSTVNSRTGASALPKGGEEFGAVQFPPCSPQTPSCDPPAFIWKFPPLAHWLPQQSGDCMNVVEGKQGSCHSHVREAGFTKKGCNLHVNNTALLRPPTSSSMPFIPSSSPHPSLHPSLHPPHIQPYNPSAHSQSLERIYPFMVKQEAQKRPLSQSSSQNRARLVVHNGTTFPSLLHSGAEGKPGRGYTPRPMLDPHRKGTGLYSSISALHPQERGMTEIKLEDSGYLLSINVGPDYQAKLPSYFLEGAGPGKWSQEVSPREQLLWKPWEELEDGSMSAHVEGLLSMCSSSCLPGGGSNIELAMHCLHHCHGNILAAVELLLFTHPSPAGDYHYSGSAVWRANERALFTAALANHGKDFFLIQKMVESKSVCECVEFYYHCKRLPEKQTKQMEEERVMEQQSVVPLAQPMRRQLGLEGPILSHSLATCFPCKQCGKMFYKIKSRNAHMKIHRQPQEDWTERRLQSLSHRLALNMAQKLTSNLGTSLLQSQASTPAYLSVPGSSNNSDRTRNVGVATGRNADVLNFDGAPSRGAATGSNASDSVGVAERSPASVLPLHQSWGSWAKL